MGKQGVETCAEPLRLQQPHTVSVEIEEQDLGGLGANQLQFILAGDGRTITALQGKAIERDLTGGDLNPGMSIRSQGVTDGFAGIKAGQIEIGILVDGDRLVTACL